MSIIRRASRPADNYTIIANAAVRDERLTFKARGLLGYLLSHEVGWRTTLDALAASGLDGRAAIKSAVAELKKLGYLTIARERTPDGQLGGTIWDVTDEPSLTEVTTPEVDNQPLDGAPQVGYPPVEKSTSVKKTNPEEEKKEKRSARPIPLPHDWAPSGELRPLATSLGLDHDVQAGEFKRWYRASGTIKSDWDVAFEIWLRNPKTAKTARAQAQAHAAAQSVGAVALDFAPPPCQHPRVEASGYCASCGANMHTADDGESGLF